ncbi:hypothetical protein Ddye_002601 [Dipteronia dyeriana]|uniref:RNase H type-1 domain-containing protein n=1 Tax=Dipteronia dyeriana TaxID=168575 RepID=A0AAD9XR81_9ROSI|nr:hypothetical protein Ddye_002601 [Dipteronia dyeriana]
MRSSSRGTLPPPLYHDLCVEVTGSVRGGSATVKLQNLTGVLQRWNKEEFGNLFRNKRRLLARIKVNKRLSNAFLVFGNLKLLALMVFQLSSSKNFGTIVNRTCVHYKVIQKNWLDGYALNKGMGSVTEAKLWVVSLLNSISHLNHPQFSVIQECKAFIDDDWRCIVQHIFRECNRVVDDLTSLGHALELGITYFNDPLPDLWFPG